MKEALKLALETLVEMSPSGPIGSAIWHKQMSAIRVASDALAQPDAFEQGRQEGMKQERALWELSKLGQEIEADTPKIGCVQHDCAECVARLAQPERPWKKITDEKRAGFEAALPKTQEEWDDLFNGIEAKLKEKNNG